MYRYLRANNEVQERRRLACHPEYRKPELLATVVPTPASSSLCW